MLFKNQKEHQTKFVNSSSVRDSLKNDHIKYAVEEGQRKLQQVEEYERRKHMDMKCRYKEDLLHQI